jgi:hypothetical protein
MISTLIRFLILVPIILAAFFCHWFLVSGVVHPFITKSYLFNLILALIFIVVYSVFKARISTYLGYYFLYFSLLKFFLFFILIYPNMDRTGGLRSPYFLAFFVPYMICLVHEIVFISREMNKS